MKKNVYNYNLQQASIYNEINKVFEKIENNDIFKSITNKFTDLFENEILSSFYGILNRIN